MGGNALSVPTRRINAQEYTQLASQLCERLRTDFHARAEDVPAYRQKPDFGDVDIVLEHDVQSNMAILGQKYYHDNLMEWATKHFHARQFHRNNSALSFDARQSPDDEEGVQVDLILTPKEDIDAALGYYGYNDLGNLVGRIAHKMGLVFGHQGLLYYVQEGDHTFKMLTITKDTSQALITMGYDPARYAQGFDTMDDIFQYTMSSPYFNKDIFLLENRNHTARTRDRKRKTYKAFLDLLDTMDGNAHAFEFPEDKSVWMPKLFEQYPQFKKEYDATMQEWASIKFIKFIFNGHNIGQWSGLTGKELSVFMSDVRSDLDARYGLEIFLRQHGEEGLRQHVLAFQSAPTRGRIKL